MVFYIVGDECPKCGHVLDKTYEPYQVRCLNCNFDWDNWTGKPIEWFNDEVSENAAVAQEKENYYWFLVDNGLQRAPDDDVIDV